jgi:hypothetical protein
MRSDAAIAVKMMMMMFWVVTLCRLIGIYNAVQTHEYLPVSVQGTSTQKKNSVKFSYMIHEISRRVE